MAAADDIPDSTRDAVNSPGPREGGYRNRHGRRGGRGVRPWLLLPKVIAVALWTGGLAAATWLIWTLPLAGADDAPAQVALAHEVVRIEALFWGLLTPALLTVVALGLLLTLQHPRVFVRMRWWQIKVMLAAALPVMWLLVGRSFDALDDAPLASAHLVTLRWQLTLTLGLTLAIILLGRHKPRCGQNLAQASRGKRTTAAPPEPR